MRIFKEHPRWRVMVALTSVTLAVIVLPAPVIASAEEPPVKEIITSHIGREVDKTSKASICTVASLDECQPGLASSQPGGFDNLPGLAVDDDPASPQHGNLYATDDLDNRVQELTASGTFVSTFGWNVNATKDKEPAATQAEKDICTAASGDACTAGVEGSAAGQFREPESIAVDPSAGNVYVLDLKNYRVQEFTPTGEFVLMFGREVNETAHLNHETENEDVCPVKTGDKCKAGVEGEPGGTEHGAFRPKGDVGNLLAVDGEGTVYVGDEHRVQEFHANGRWAGEIPLTSILSLSEPGPRSVVNALAVDDSCAIHEPVLTESTVPTCKAFDPSDGDVYLSYEVQFKTPTIYKFTATGTPVTEFDPVNRTVGAMAVDSSGRLAVGEGGGVGALYAQTGRLITTIAGLSSLNRPDATGFAFGPANGLYAATNGNEYISYMSEPVADLLTSPVACEPGASSETDATFDCSLHGEANPEGVAETESWFQWGRTVSLDSQTAKQSIPTGNTPAAVSAPVAGLLPDETYHYRLAGYDHNVKAPELLDSETASFMTPLAPPGVAAEPTSSFVGSSSVVLFGELNPENADTRYAFQYGMCENLEACPSRAETPSTESATYGSIPIGAEATGLQPGTVYHYRLVAESENAAKTEKLTGAGPQGSFTTLPAPIPRASTGMASGITPTTAVISGTVDPDGLPAAYIFELGVYDGAETYYGTVFSGPAGSAASERTLALGGLQPGTTYAYRIAVRSGYVNSESHTVLGAQATFTTAGLPSVLVTPAELAILEVPGISFPKPAAVTAKGQKKTKKKKTRRTKDKRSKKGAANKSHDTSRPVKGGK